MNVLLRARFQLFLPRTTSLRRAMNFSSLSIGVDEVDVDVMGMGLRLGFREWGWGWGRGSLSFFISFGDFGELNFENDGFLRGVAYLGILLLLDKLC